MVQTPRLGLRKPAFAAVFLRVLPGALFLFRRPVERCPPSTAPSDGPPLVAHLLLRVVAVLRRWSSLALLLGFGPTPGAGC